MRYEELNFVAILIDGFFSILALYTCHIFLAVNIKYTIEKKKYIFASYVLFLIITFVTGMLDLNPFVNFIIFMLGIMLIGLLYSSTILRKLIYVLVISLTMAVFENVIISIWSIARNTTTDNIMLDFNLSLFLYAISKFIPFIVVKLYAIMKKENGYKENSDILITTKIQLLMIPLISIGILQVSTNLTRADSHNIAIVITFSIIVMNIIFLNLYEKVTVLTNEKIQNIVLNNQIEYYLSLYENLNVEREETLKIKHNIKNIAISIKTFLKTGEVEKAIEELDNILESEVGIKKVISEIPIIDAIVNYKIQFAKKYDIQINTKIILNKNANIDNSDVANILGNALDNAIEACRKNIDKNNKIITLDIHMKQENIYIGVSNPFEEEIKLKDGFPISSKRKNSYGIGLKTIEKITRDKNNIMNFSIVNNTFNLEIIIFLTSK